MSTVRGVRAGVRRDEIEYDRDLMDRKLARRGGQHVAISRRSEAASALQPQKLPGDGSYHDATSECACRFGALRE